MGEYDSDLALFAEYVPNAQEATVTYSQWRKQQKGEFAKWEAFRDALLRGESSEPPEMSTRFGKALVLAGKQHMSITHLVGIVTPPATPTDPPPEDGGPPDPPPAEPVFTTNIVDGQAITLPFTWTASVDPTPDSIQFWADGVLQELDSTSPFSHEMQLASGAHALGLCAFHGATRTCYAPLGGGVFANVTVSGTPDPPPPSTYDYRFATFNTATDSINGTFNKYSPPGYWWVPGQTPPGGTWPSGGGLYEISTPFGPGIDVIVTQEMDYVGATPLGGWDLSRFVGFHDTGYPWRGQEQVWEWTWMWPSSGNPSGWANTWVTAEGLTFPTLTPGGSSIVGHHLFLHYANPMTLRFGRNTYVSTAPAEQAWQFYIASNSGVTFPPDTYQHIRIEVFWTETSAGYIRVYAQNEGSAEIQWVNYSGVTLPTGWNPRSMYCNLRKISTHPRNQIHWINHRLTVL